MAGQIASFYAKIGADDNDFKRAMEGVDSKLSSSQKGFASFEKAVSLSFKAIGVAAVAAFAAVGAAVVGSIKAAADFEQGVTDIGAVMNLTGKEAEQLQDHIMDLGMSPDLKVSATEATDAIMSLGTAGLDLQQIMGGASEATVQLSNATGGDMANSAALMTDIMSQFNITAGETGRIVDQVTGLTVASKFGFADAALAISQAGGVAGSTGMEFEDFNAILGVTASNFSSGSDAGTSLKTFLTTLIPKSAEAADVMRDLGLYTGLTGKEFEDTQGKINKLRERIAELDPTSKNYSDKVNGLNAEINELNATLVKGGSAFFDANGNMRSAEEIAGALAQAFGGLTEAQRNDAAATIFGADAMRTAFGLIKGGTPAITAMKDEIAKVDAGNIAAKRMDTFAGAMEIAQGVIETISISIGQQFLPILRPLVESFSNLAQVQGPRLVAFFGDLAARMGDGIQKGIEWAQNVLPPLWQRMQQVGNAIKIVTDHVRLAIKPITDAIGKWVGWQDVLTAVGILLGGAVLTAIGGFIAAMTPVILLVAKVTAVIAALRAAWDTNFLGIRDITEDVLDRISDWLQAYTNVWKGSWGRTLNFFTTNTNEAWRSLTEGVQRWIGDMVRETKHVISVWVQNLTDRFEAWYSTTYFGIRSWMVKTVRVFTDFKEDAVDWLEKLFGWFKPNEWLQKGKDIVQGLKDGMEQAWEALMRWWDGVWGKDLTKTVQVKMETNSPSKVMEDLGVNVMKGFGIGAEKMLPYVESVMAGIPTASISAGEYAYAGALSSDSGMGGSEELSLLRRSNELLTILIAELRNKNMSVTVAGASGDGGIGAYNALESGLKR